MSGTRLFSYREGDRSEYLAVYLLSGLGLVTQVPRQEDIGFDLVCSIADQEHGVLTFDYNYLVSVKSVSYPDIELCPPKTGAEDLPHIGWLFKQDSPLFLGVVDKEKTEINLYSTLPVWFIHYENKDCGELILKPRADPMDPSDVGKPKKERELAVLPGRFAYTVDLGHPVVRLHIKDLKDKERLRCIKDQLRECICYARLARMHADLGVPHFYWFARTHPDGSRPTPAFYYDKVSVAPAAEGEVFAQIAPTLIALAMRYQITDDKSKLESVRTLLREVPQEHVPELIRKHLIDVFKD